MQGPTCIFWANLTSFSLEGYIHPQVGDTYGSACPSVRFVRPYYYLVFLDSWQLAAHNESRTNWGPQHAAYMYQYVSRSRARPRFGFSPLGSVPPSWSALRMPCALGVAIQFYNSGGWRRTSSSGSSASRRS